MDPSRSWAPRWLNKEQGVGVDASAHKLVGATNSLQAECGTIREDLAVQTRINVVHVRDISENGQLEIGKDHFFTSFAFEHVNRTKLQLNISLDRKIWNWTLIEILIKKNNCSAGGRIEPVETPSARHAVCRPRFKILASFMMPIARMLARIYTILAPYGTRPRPIFETDMEAIFQEMKEKQEASDKAFEEVRLKSLESDIVDKKSLSLSGKRVVTGKPTKRSRKPSGPILGSTVQIVSRTFTDFTGTIKKPDKKKRSGMHSPYVTIGLTWNDNIADLILSDIVDEQK
ncbi:plastid transcriptionally active 13 [Tanacetum coccineum]